MADASKVTVYGLIPARGGSKGIPRKNLRPIAGRPLIAWTLAAARASRRLTRTLVSTDDPEIADAARASGVEVPFLRPAALAADDSPTIDVVRHALDWLTNQGGRPDYLVLLQPTSPLRTTDDIDAAIEEAVAHAASVVSVTPSSAHPFLMYRKGPSDDLLPYLPDRPSDLRRQVLPPAFALNGAIYVCPVDRLLETGSFTPPGTLAYVMPPERSVDIDTPWDWQVAEWTLLARSRAGLFASEVGVR